MLDVDAMSGFNVYAFATGSQYLHPFRVLVSVRSIEDVILAVDHGAPDVSQHAFLVDVLHPGAVIESPTEGRVIIVHIAKDAEPGMGDPGDPHGFSLVLLTILLCGSLNTGPQAAEERKEISVPQAVEGIVDLLALILEFTESEVGAIPGERTLVIPRLIRRHTEQGRVIKHDAPVKNIRYPAMLSRNFFPGEYFEAYSGVGIYP
jgi:hypothetical protein